jgi:hypothetical protein
MGSEGRWERALRMIMYDIIHSCEECRMVFKESGEESELIPCDVSVKGHIHSEYHLN